VSTAFVSDGIKPYETAIQHPLYNGGDWIIVDSYDTKEEASEGHDKWVGVITSENLPDTLEDVGNTEMSQLLKSIDTDGMVFTKERIN
jgi:hypothetical protein